MNAGSHPFYSGETVTGQVVALGRRCASLNIRRWIVQIDKEFIDWNALRSPSELLSIGDRLQVVVHLHDASNPIHRKYRLTPRHTFHGAWASRLPLLDDPWPELQARYPEGTVVEVEMIDYVNWYIARVRMPEGLVVELRINDIHIRSSRTTNYQRPLCPGERFKVVFRKAYRPGGWVERHFGGSMDDCLAESGYITQGQAAIRLTLREQAFLKVRNG
ncbi:MAG: hypothetical protein LBU43_01710 [Candidatus Accumulibacter sp.]|jgi:hypothetical protein|nr:hypothetical protein [Accumulibacter sp.]